MSAEFYKSFELEILKSEVQRTRLLLGTFLLALVVVVVNYFLLDAEVAAFYGGLITYFAGILMLVFLIGYEYTGLLWLRKSLRRGKKFKTSSRIIQSIIEVTVPSLMLYYMIEWQHMMVFIDSPVAMLYFLFIILSVLHLDFKISLITGIVSGIQYAAVVYYGFRLEGLPQELSPHLPENGYYLRSIFLVICGGAAGFVAEELKKRMRSTFELEQAKSEIEDLFGQQVSREIVRTLVENRDSVKKHEASVLALDIRDFSLFAEKRSPDEIMEYQNKIFGPILDIINQHQGVVNQILGDGIMATFGTPIENPLHAEMAFQSAIQIIDKVKQLSERGEIPYSKIGIGLHAGEVITGNIGNASRKQFSISGTAVITAFRVEQLTKVVGGDLLVTQAFLDKVTPGKRKIESVGARNLKGFENPVEIYKVG
ncbi:MAG: adenylate/guanylate cyclase domain-containing protein [Flammeovirgaceae bacterium]|nr:adenylate/guanylate cyclase domain-containing protein [Flammeovirgaceae bacterium]